MVRAGIDDPKMFKVQVVQRDAHGSGDSWRFTELEFHTVTAAAVEEKQIELSAAIGGPKEPLGGTADIQKLIHGKSLPGGAYSWIPPEGVHVMDAEQRMEKTGITQIDFGRFDLSFADVFIPGLKLVDHKRTGQNIQVRTHGFVGQAHGASQLRGVNEAFPPALMERDGLEVTLCAFYG
jgi:hypothetical protein